MSTSVMTVHETPRRRDVLAGWRPWHPATSRTGTFAWALGARAAVAFVGPTVVAHMFGLNAAHAAVMGVAGLIVSLVCMPATTVSTAAGLGVAVTGTVVATAALSGAVDLHARVLLLAVAGLVAGLTLRAPLVPRAVAQAAALTLIIGAALPPGAVTGRFLLAGGLLAVVAVVATARFAVPAPVRHFTTDVAVHHALRLAALLAIAGVVQCLVGTGSEFGSHARWLALGMWVALDPMLDATVMRASQRLAGTFAGAAFIAVLVTALGGHPWLGWVGLALAFIAFSIRPVNYSWYCAALMPVIVLGTGPMVFNGEVLAARVVWTALGVGAALAVRLVAWPTVAHRELGYEL
jgi:hypothetical protein